MSRHSGRIRLVAALVASVLVGGLVVPGAHVLGGEGPAIEPVPVGPELLTVERISQTAAGDGGSLRNYEPSISDDGRRITFSAQGPELGGNGGTLLLDRDTATLTHVAFGYDARISGDGSTIVYVVPGDYDPETETSAPATIEVRDLTDEGGGITQIGLPELVDPDSEVMAPAINFDGSVVAFAYREPGATAWSYARATATEVTSIGGAGDAVVAAAPAVSPDGSNVVFLSHDPVAGWQFMLSEVGTSAQAFATLEARPDLGSADAWLGSPDITADGGHVAMPGVGDVMEGRVLLFDLTQPLAAPQVLAPFTDETRPFGSVMDVSISGDGRHVAFVASSYTSPEPPQLWIHDRDADVTSLVSRTGAGGPGDGSSERPALSGDGSSLVFASGATDLVDGDDEGVMDVFLASRINVVAPVFPGDAVIAADDVTDHSFVASWPAAGPGTGGEAPDHYVVTVGDRAPVRVAAPTTTLAVGGLDADTEYPVKVVAGTPGGGVSAPLTGSARTAVFVPATLTATVRGNEVDLSWVPITRTDVDAYEIVRWTDDGALAANFVVPLDQTTFTDHGLEDGRVYEYEVWGLMPDRLRAVPHTKRVTVTTDFFLAEITATEESDGAVRVSWGFLGTGSEFVIERALASSPDDFTEVGRVPFVGDDSFRDTTVDGETAYLYRVLRVVDGATRPHTGTVAITTGPVTAGSLSWSAPRVGSTLLRAGGEVAIELVGQHNRTATATVDLIRYPEGGGDPAPTSVDVPLGEVGDTPGTYRGTLTLPPATTTVSAITGVLSDGAGHESAPVAGAGLPVEVSAVLLVTMGGPAATRADARLVVRAGWDGVQVPLEAATTEYVVEPLVPGVHSVEVLTSEGQSSFELQGLTLAAGERRQLTIEPALLTDVTFTVVGGDGHPVDGTLLVDDHLRSQVARPSFGGPAVVHDVAAGAPVTVTFSSNPGARRIARHASLTFTPVAGDTTPVVVDVPALPSATISGRVTADDTDTGIRGARVSAEQIVDGRSFSAATVTADDGSYQLDVLQGEVEVFATNDVGRPAEAPPVVVAGDLDGVDRVILTPQRYTIEPTVIADYLDQAPTTLPLDWVNSYHYAVRLRTERGHNFIITGPSPVDVAKGDTVTLCADGWEVSLPKACTSVVAGDDRTIPISVTMLEKARVQGAFAGGGAATRWSAWLSGPNGATHGIGVGSTFQVPVDAPGDYRLSIATSGGGLGWQSFSREVIVTEEDMGSIIDVGTLAAAAAPPDFGGSVVTIGRGSVVPGGVADVRAVVVRQGTEAQVELHLAAPAGTELVAGSVTVDGAPVALGEDDTSVDLGTVEPWRDRVVRWQLRAAASAAGSQLAVSPEVSADGGDPVPLGVAYLVVHGVAVEAPPVVPDIEDVPFSGRAPAGKEVVLYEGAERLGSATANGGGFWRLTADLADRGTATYHLVRAEVAGHDPATTSIQVDADEPEVVRMTVQQPGGRVVEWDPRTGTARFPYVWVPGKPMLMEVTFSDPDRVEDVVARMGEAGAQAERGEDDVFRATVPADGSASRIEVAYDVVPLMPSLAEFPVLSEEEQLAERPVVLRDVTPAGSDALPAGVGVDLDVPALGDADTRVELEAADVAPTDEPAAGFGEWNVVFEEVETADGIEYVLEAEVPEEDLPGGAEVAAAPELRAGARFGAAAAGLGQLKSLVTKLKVKNQADLVDLITKAEGLLSALATGEKFEKIASLLDLTPGCKSPARESYEQQIENLHTKAKDMELALLAASTAAGEITSKALDVVGDAVSPAHVLLVNLNVYGFFKILGDAFAMNVDFLVDGIEENILNDPQCNADDHFPSARVLHLQRAKKDRQIVPADPVLAHDPSGYVYEAVASNRIAGVTAIALYRQTPDGGYSDVLDGAGDIWAEWEADWFGQANPLITDPNGRYAWDVPEGWWRVAWSKEGYEPALSAPVEVLPPRYDVNAGMVSLAAPTVTGVTAVAGPGSAVEVTFDKYMHPASVEHRISVSSGGAAVAGTVAAVAPEASPEDELLSRRFRFTPAAPFADAQPLRVLVDDLVLSYADRPMAGDAVRDVTAALPAVPPPPPGPSLPPPAGGGSVPAAVPTAGDPVTAVVANGTVAVGSGGAPEGFRLLGRPLQVEGPAATAETPHVLTIRVHPSALAAGEIPVVWRDDVRVAARCTSPSAAAPDPCLASLRDVGGQYWELVVRTSHYSRWMVTAPAPGSIAAACPPGPSAAAFGDVTAGNAHAAAVACLAARGIARGVGVGRYSPASSVTRAQMASFLTRLLAEAGVALPAAPAAAFTDVTGVHALAVDQLAALGIARGTGGGRFDPASPVSRAQMASFIVRAVEVAGGALPAGADAFADDDGSAHEAAIDRAAAAGIALGVSDRAFAPDQPVRRDQMASFLARTLNRLVLDPAR